MLSPKPTVFIFKSGWCLQNHFDQDPPTCSPKITFSLCSTDDYVMGIPQQPWIFIYSSFAKISSWASLKICSWTCASWQFFPPSIYLLSNAIVEYNTTNLSNNDHVKILEYQNPVQLNMQSIVDHHLLQYLMLELPVVYVPFVVKWECHWESKCLELRPASQRDDMSWGWQVEYC